MIRPSIGIVLIAVAPAIAQGPPAKLAPPSSPPMVRGSGPDPFQDGPRLPSARLGPISGSRIGEGPEAASAEERYNWGAARDRRDVPASRSRERTTARERPDDIDRDRDTRNDRRGARLRDPAPGKLTSGRGRGEAPAPYLDEPPPPPSPYGEGPAWWPNREQDLADLREQFPAFGEQDRDRLAFESDCAFDDFVSPLSNPFLAEDPRSLTELRLMYFYQAFPGSHPYFHGGNAQFFGAQARVAFTERFSVVLHKFGGMGINPNLGSPAPNGSGFAELWVGPKFVFWRVPDSQSIASAGLQLQLPIGSADVFQDTGGIALVPYLSFGRRLGETDYGTFQLINVTGYHLGTDDRRSDYFYNTLHIALDYQDFHRFYPVLELNWFHYTTNGTERPGLAFEGRDLANFGGQASGQNYVSIAPGFRYKFTDFLQLGVFTEFGLVGSDDLNRFRVGVDLIWRY